MFRGFGPLSCFFFQFFSLFRFDVGPLLGFDCLLDSGFVLFDLLTQRVQVVGTVGIEKERVQVAQALFVDAAHHPDVSVFQFGVAHVADAVVQPMDMYAAANDGEREPEHAERRFRGFEVDGVDMPLRRRQSGAGRFGSASSALLPEFLFQCRNPIRQFHAGPFDVHVCVPRHFQQPVEPIIRFSRYRRHRRGRRVAVVQSAAERGDLLFQLFEELDDGGCLHR